MEFWAGTASIRHSWLQHAARVVHQHPIDLLGQCVLQRARVRVLRPAGVVVELRRRQQDGSEVLSRAEVGEYEGAGRDFGTLQGLSNTDEVLGRHTRPPRDPRRARRRSTSRVQSGCRFSSLRKKPLDFLAEKKYTKTPGFRALPAELLDRPPLCVSRSSASPLLHVQRFRPCPHMAADPAGASL